MCGALWSTAEAALERWLVRFALYFASVKAAAMVRAGGDGAERARKKKRRRSSTKSPPPPMLKKWPDVFL
jgi:hypothetical protein